MDEDLSSGCPAGWPGTPRKASEPSSARTQTTPVTLHTCIQSPWPEPVTTACARVGTKAFTTSAKAASQAARRRGDRRNGPMRVEAGRMPEV
jgi:hypothetical protein